MTAPRGEGRGAKGDDAQEGSEQIEYLLYQSTQGHHFMFDHHEIKKILKSPTLLKPSLDLKDMQKVQGLLSSFLEKETIGEKRSFTESLPRAEYELLVRAYFQLVDKTILAHTNLRH